MTSNEFTAKLQEFRATITDTATHLEEHPKWAGGDERVQIIHELEELAVEVESLILALEEQEDMDGTNDE